MDAEPKSLRPFLLLATSFVIFGCVAAYLYWWTAREQEGVGLLPGPHAAAALHPVDFLARTPPAERSRLLRLVAQTLAGSGGEPSPAEAELVAAGEDAVPPLLDALYRLSGRALQDVEARDRMRRADRVLFALRARLSPASPAVEPSAEPDAAEELRRAREWFQWWEQR